MNELQIFKNKEFGEIRTVLINEKPHFVGVDIAKALGYKRPTNAINQHCKGTLKQGILTKGGTQEMNVITEGDIYRLIVKSELPSAEKFESWVFDEVLPSIRKHGGYIKNQENISSEELLANAVLVAQNVIKEKDKLLEEQKPKVLFAEAVENSEDVILVKEMANILSQRGFTIGQNQLYQFLRDKEYLCKKKGDMYHLPTKRYQHFFKVTKNIVQNSKGSKVSNTPKITGKGQVYFIKKFDEFLEQGLTVRDLLKEDKQ